MRPCKSSSQLHRVMTKAGVTLGSVAFVATMFSVLPAVTAPVPAPATSTAASPTATTLPTTASDQETGTSGSQPVPAPPLPPAAATLPKATAAPAPIPAAPLPPTPSPADLAKLKPADSGHEMGRAGKSAPAATASAPSGPAIVPGTSLNSGLGSQHATVQLAVAPAAAPAVAPAVAPMAAIQPDGTAGLPLGMDVSGWQQNVDWQTAWNNGARFAYIKASEGPWTLNDYFSQQYNGSYAAGMIRGAYAFARPNLSSGANQAAVLVQSGGGWSADGRTLPGVLDIETNGSDNSGACFGMTPAQLTSWTADFTQTYRNLTGRDAVIYTAYYFWQNCMGGTTAFSQSNPLWIAAYGAPADDVWMPGGWPQFTFWQYNNGSGTFPGDQNLFNGSYAQLQTLALGYKAQASRVAGPDRIGTALVAAGKIFSTDGQTVSADGSNVKPGAKYVYLTRDDDYPDALSVGPLAAKNKGVVLVNPSGALDDRVSAFLAGLKAAGVDVHLSIVGGTDAVSDAVASASAQALGTASAVGRIQGADRYATSLAIANLVSPVSGANGDVFLATGRDFADALTAGAAAARNASASDPAVATAISPVLLTDGSTLSAAAQGYVAAKSAGARVYAVGGAAAQAYPAAVLLSGSDRYGTAAKVAQQFWTVRSTDVNTLNVGIASGFTFADAVIGASYMALNNGPLLLTAPGSLSSPTSNYLNSNRGAIGTVFIFGGSVTISSNVAAQASSALSS